MTSWTKRRTFTRERLEASRAAWDAGEFSGEWSEWRHLAAMEAGIIDPPTGTKWDDWGDDSPSQRAMLVRAIRETPDALRAAIRAPGVRSWGDVIARLLGHRDRMREAVEQDERDVEHRRATFASPRQATYTIRDILDIVRDSA